jgi:predicted ATPase
VHPGLAVGAIGRRLTDVPVALVACLRPAPRPAELERLLAGLDGAPAELRTLGQLPDQAVAELVAETVGAEPGGRLVGEVAAAGGNPLFVTELVGALVQEGVVRTLDGRAEVTRVAMPPTLRLTILRRLGLLPEGVHEVLRAASILGSGFSLAELSTTTGRSALDLSPALAEAIRARVLEDDGGRLRFRHDLIREALYEDLPASVRLGLHREARRRLARAGASTLQVAEHLARGATPGDADAVAWLARAAREAAPRSPAAAVELFERAVGLALPSDPGRDLLLAEQAGALMWSGRLADAEATCRSLLDRDHDPAAEGPARICLARTLIAQGRTPEALEELERARRSPALTDHDRARALGWAAWPACRWPTSTGRPRWPPRRGPRPPPSATTR